MQELISVVLNVYNEEKLFPKCLESVINQTYKNLDILIINDGSTDNTLNICKAYQNKDKRIRIINQENMGLAKSRNVGIENSIGEYLYFVDSDDFIAEDTIEYLYNLCIKYDTKIATSVPLDIYSYKFEFKNKEEKIEIISNKEMLRRILFSECRAVTFWNKLVKKELYDNLRFEDRPINDVAFTYKLALTTDRIAFSNQIKYFYLRHKNSITEKKKNDSARDIDAYKVGVERYNYIKNIYPDFIENEIGLIRSIIKFYLAENSVSEEYFKNENVIDEFRKLFSFKIFFSKIRIKEKLKILFFWISPSIVKKFAKTYRNIRFKYEM